jgi:hypothetical protein
MGQWLSLPMVAAGVALWAWSVRRGDAGGGAGGGAGGEVGDGARAARRRRAGG